MSKPALLWIALLTAASTVTTWALACATPFAALAALAAMHMRRRDGLALILAAWVLSQAVGFGVLHYPHDPKTLLWGGAIATAALAAAGGAQVLLARVRPGAPPLRLGLAFVAAFATFKGMLVLWSVPLGGLGIALDVRYATAQFAREGLILIGLLALYHALTALGVPGPRPAVARRNAAATF